MGREYRNPLVNARAYSWEFVASQLAAGVESAAALDAGDRDFTARRRADFSGATAALDKIAPGGEKGHGAELAQAFRDLSNGIKAGP